MACSCADIQLIIDAQTMVIDDQTVIIDDHWALWYENLATFEMELGQGLGQIADAWRACCELQYAPVDSVYWQPGTPAIGNPGDPNYVAAVPGMYISGAPQIPPNAFGALMGHQAHVYQSDQWATAMRNWIQAYEDWQTTQQLIGVGQLALYFAQLGEFIDAYKDFQACANQAQAGLKNVLGELGTVAAGARDDYDAHVSDAVANIPFDWNDVADAIQKVCNIDVDFEQYQSGACFGYEEVQKDHVQNMGDHLAQLCANARDVSNNLKTCLEFLDDAWLAGGIWDQYEQSLSGPDGLMEYLAQAHTTGNEITEQLTDCGEFLESCLADEGGSTFVDSIKPAIAKMIDQMCLAGGTLESLRDASDQALQCSQDIKAHFDTVYAAQEGAGGVSDKIMGVANDLFCSPEGSTFIKDCLTTLQDCVVSNKDILDNYLGAPNDSGEYCLGRTIIDQACLLVEDLQNAVTFLDEHSVNCIADYEASYQGKEGTLALTLLNSACDLAQCVQASHTWMSNHAAQLETCWADAYEGEKSFVSDALAEANELVTQHSDTLQCLLDCAAEAKTCYTTGYLQDEKVTASLVHQNAQDLAGCLPLAHDWLCTQADKNRDRYCEFWAPKEDNYVCSVLDKAIELSCESKDCLTEWCEQLDEQWEWWNECFEDAEKQAIPKLIEAAIDACEKNQLTYMNACDRSDELYSKYMDEWCPCDIEDLEKHCQIWGKVNMLEEICDANSCLRTTAEILKECYKDMLECEKKYLDFVCDMSYDPKYCDMETRAVAHVIKQYDEQLDELEQCIPPWCRAAFIDRAIDVKSDRANATQVAVQVADRWEWLRNVHEEDRKHNYLQDVVNNFGERWISNSHEMYRSVQQGNDLLLNHVHNRIQRGRLYLESSFGHLDRTLTALDGTVRNSIQAVQQSHFWPDWYNQGRSSYLQHSNNYLNSANNILELGHGLYRQASDDKSHAASIAENAVQSGLATIDRGHRVKQHAMDAATRADDVISGLDQTAANLIQQGHNLHRMAADAQNNAGQVALEATNQGIQTIDRGHRVKQMALDAANSQGQLAHAGIQDGLAGVDDGHFWAEMSQRGIDSKLAGFSDAWRNTVQHLEHGRNYLSDAARWGDIANTALRTEVNAGEIGMSNALGWFNTAQRKLEVALEAQNDHVREAVQMLGQGYGRMNTVLDAKDRMQNQIRNSTDGLMNMAGTGNRFLFAGADANIRGAEMKKQALMCVCDMIRNRYLDTQGLEISLGSSIMGSSYNASQNALGQVQGLLNGIGSAIQQIAGPPPSLPLGGGGFGGGFGGGGSFGGGYNNGGISGYPGDGIY